MAYSLHPRPTNTRCLKPHMEKARQMLGKLPRTVIADAGYGSEENYAYLEKEEIQAVVKYGSYHKEKSKETQPSGYEIQKRHYRSQNCEGYPLKERCTKAVGNREVVVSLERLRYQNQAREILRSEEGYALAVRRMIEPESVF
ncbi:transposase [Paenibacillus sp. CMAA1364]